MIRTNIPSLHPRTATLVLPTSYRPGTPIPLVLGFHGGLGGPRVFEAQTRLTACAERSNFAVCYPSGTGFGQALTWNAGTCCGYAQRFSIDDVGFVRRLVSEIQASYSIDPKRIYAAGFSNGAMLCYRLACEAPELFAAVGVVSGSLPPMFTPKPMPLIAFHGLRDMNCPYAGGFGHNAVQPVNHTGFEATVAKWVAANGCPVKTAVELGNAVGKRRLWSNAQGTQVEAWTLTEGGHTWPGGVDVSRGLGTGKLIASVDATGEVWRFFKGKVKA